MMSSNWNIFHVIGLSCGEFTSRTPVNSPHKGQWRRALMFSLICACTNGWVNSRQWFQTPSRSLWRNGNSSGMLRTNSEVQVVFISRYLQIHCVLRIKLIRKLDLLRSTNQNDARFRKSLSAVLKDSICWWPRTMMCQIQSNRNKRILTEFKFFKS